MTGTIIITGASSGIGRATAQEFLRRGWRVGLLARRREALEAVAQGHARAHVLLADVRAPDEVRRAFADFVRTVGRLDVLFNNAGRFGPPGTIDEISDEDWETVLGVNLSGMFYAAREAFSQMRRQSPQGGRIINNGSVSAHVPRAGSVCYTTTKHGVTGLTRTLSLDGRPFDIACGQIDIGNARTELLEELIERQARENPGAPPVETMDVADAARSVVHMAEMPLSANVQFMTVMATKMPYIGRG